MAFSLSSSQYTFGRHASSINHYLSVLTVAQPESPVCLISRVTLHQQTKQTTRLMLEHVIFRLQTLANVNFVYQMEFQRFSLKSKTLSQPIFSSSLPMYTSYFNQPRFLDGP